MSMWECCELLNEVVGESDPDLDEPQIEHLLQTAEAIRKDYPNEDWLHLTGLIHDLGKVLQLSSFGNLPQSAVVGDTCHVGCAFDESIVHHKAPVNLSYTIRAVNCDGDCSGDWREGSSSGFLLSYASSYGETVKVMAFFLVLALLLHFYFFAACYYMASWPLLGCFYYCIVNL